DSAIDAEALECALQIDNGLQQCRPWLAAILGDTATSRLRPLPTGWPYQRKTSFRHHGRPMLAHGKLERNGYMGTPTVGVNDAGRPGSAIGQSPAVSAWLSCATIARQRKDRR